MKRISIATDSTSDLSEDLIRDYDITVMPLHVNMGDKEYLDGVNITPEELYRWSDANNETPKTSAISLEEAYTCMENLLKSSEKIIVFCIAQEMSSCYSVMKMAADALEAEDRVFIIDSKNLSTGIGLQILAAATMAKEGADAVDIVKAIEKMQPYVRASFVVDTLTYLHRGGRCSGLAALAGGALKLHPLIEVIDGRMQPGKKYRGRMHKVIIDYVTELTDALNEAEENMVFITHSGCNDEVIESVKEKLEVMNYFHRIYVTRAGSVISSHCGPGTLGVLFVSKH